MPGRFKSRLPNVPNRPFQSVQVVLYNENNEKVDVDVTDERGTYEFTGVPNGNYEVRFFGRNYGPEDYLNITIIDFDQIETSSERYYIRPLDGSVFKNDSGNLTFELVRIYQNVQEIVTSGDVKLCTRESGSYVDINPQDAGVVSFDGYTLTVNGDFVEDVKTIYAVNKTENPSTEWDATTIADIKDARGFISWTSVSSFVAVEDSAGFFSPNQITLDVNFAFDGSIIDVVNDSNFSFTNIPDGAATGISVNNSTGRVTISTEDYFSVNDIFSAEWEGTYQAFGQSYITGVSESVYKAAGGADAKLVRLSASSQIFHYDDKGEPDPTNQTIEFNLDTQNLASSNVNWSITDASGTTLPASTITVSPDNLSATLAISDFGSRQKVTVSVEADGLEDRISIYRVVDGSTTVVSYLTNEAHIIPTDGSGANGDYSNAQTEIWVFRGNERIDTDPSVTFEYTPDPGVIIDTTDPAVGFVNVTNLDNIDSGQVKIDVIIDSSIVSTKYFSLSKSKFGDDGKNAKLVRLESSSKIFHYDGQGQKDPLSQEITFTFNKQNLLSNTTTWEVLDESGLEITPTILTNVTNDSATLTISNFNNRNKVTVKATADGLSDQVSIYKVVDGSNSLISILTNEAHIVPTDGEGNNGDYSKAETEIWVLRGNDRIDADPSVTFNYTPDPGVVIATTDPNVGFVNVTNLDNIDSGQVKIDVIIDSSIVSTKYFSLSKSKFGTDGVNAKTVRLESSSQLFHYDGQLQPDPSSQTITFNFDKQNLDSSTATWEVFDSSGLEITPTLLSNITNDSATLSISDFGNRDKVTIKATADGLSDQVSIYKVVDGSSSLTSFLTNESHVIPTDSSGNNGDYSNAQTEIWVLRGNDRIDTDPSVTFNYTPDPGVIIDTTNPNVGFVNVTNLDNVDSGQVKIDVIIDSSVVSTKYFSLSKSKFGTNGENAKLVRLEASGQLFRYDGRRQPDPSNQTLTFSFDQQNLDGAITTWEVFDDTGTIISPTILINQSNAGAQLTISDFDFRDKVTVKATADGLSDQISVYKVIDGSSSLTSFLTNESHLIPTDSVGDNGDYSGASTEMRVLRGDDRIDNTVDVTFSFTADPGIIIGSQDTANGAVSVSDMTIDAGKIQIDATIDGTTILTKYFSLSKSRAGINGTGATAKLMRLRSSSQIFRYDGDNNPDPPTQEITFTADRQNLDSSTVTWTVENASGTNIGNSLLSIAGNIATLTVADFGSNTSLTIIAEADNITDKVSVYRVVDGSGAITTFLTNESHVIDTENDGSGGDYSGAATDIWVYKGDDRIDGLANVGFVFTPDSGITIDSGASNTSTGFLKISSISNATTTGRVKIDVTLDGTTVSTKYFSISKSVSGRSVKGLRLLSSGNLFKFNSDDVASPTIQNIVFTVRSQNLENNSVTWTVTDNSDVLITPSPLTTPTDQDALLSIADFGSRDKVTVKIEADGLSDQVSVYRVTDGSSGLTAILTNESHTVPTDDLGNNGLYSGAETDIQVLRGDDRIEQTSEITFSYTPDTGITLGTTDTNNGFVSVTNMTVDSGRVQIDVLVDSVVTLTKYFSLSKTKAGSDGDGAPGDDSPFIELEFDEQPNENGWFNQSHLNANSALTWRLLTGSTSFTYRYKLWKQDQTEPASWTNWDGNDKEITTQGKWTFKLQAYDSSAPALTITKTDYVLLEIQDPVWTSANVSVVSGFGMVSFDWNNENISSFSGGNNIIVKMGTTSTYSSSSVKGVVEETQDYWTYNDLEASNNWNVFLDVRSIAGNTAENVYNFGPFSVLSMKPSNLRNELTIIEEGVSGTYYQILYRLSNRIDTLQIAVSAATNIVGLQYLNDSGAWVSVSGLEIENSPFTSPESIDTSQTFVLKWDKVDAYGLRVELNTPSNVNFFNVVEKLAAETFIGETFEAQRGIKFINETTDSLITIDDFGIQGWNAKSISNETFKLQLDGNFFVGYESYPGKSDSYIKFDPSANSGQGLFTVKGRGEIEEGSIGNWDIVGNKITSFTDGTGGITLDSGNLSLDMEIEDPAGNPEWVFRMKPNAILPSTLSVTAFTTITFPFPPGTSNISGSHSSNVVNITTGGFLASKATEIRFRIESSDSGVYGEVKLEGSPDSSGDNWETFRSIDISYSVPFGTDYEIIRSLSDYQRIRMTVNIRQGSIDLTGNSNADNHPENVATSITVQQYNQRTVVNQDGIFAKITPLRTSALTGATGAVSITQAVAWSEVDEKPFTTIGTDLQVSSDSLRVNSTKSSQWTSAYNNRITSVGGNGNGTLTLGRPNTSDLTTSLAHSHGRGDIPSAIAYEDEANTFTQTNVFSNTVTYNKSLIANQVLLNFNVHRSFDIRRENKTDDSSANLLLQSNVSGNYWEVSHSGDTIVIFNENRVETYKPLRLVNTSLQLNGDTVISTTKIGTFSYVELENPGNTTTRAVRADRVISTGNGLTGGGNLTSNRTIALGTPNTVNVTTTNSITSSSHTHTLDLSGRSLTFNNSNENVLTWNTNAYNLGDNRTWVPTIAAHATGQWGVIKDTAQNIYGNKTFINDAFFTDKLSSPGAVSGQSGWQGNSDGVWDFRKISADELYVQAFIAEISQALVGSDFLTKSLGILSRDFVVPFSGTSPIYFEDLDGFPNTPIFNSTGGDYLRLRVIDRSGGGLNVYDVWGTVSGYLGLAGGEQRWSFSVTDNGNVDGETVYAGSLALDYGASGDGFIERTVLDPSGSPYSQVVTWTNDPSNSNNYTTHTRTGNLEGISNASGYGFYGENTFLTGSLLVGDLSKNTDYFEYLNGDLTFKGSSVNIQSGSTANTFILSDQTIDPVGAVHGGFQKGLFFGDIDEPIFDPNTNNISGIFLGVDKNGNRRFVVGNNSQNDLFDFTVNGSLTLRINAGTVDIGDVFSVDSSTNSGTFSGWNIDSTQICKEYNTNEFFTLSTSRTDKSNYVGISLYRTFDASGSNSFRLLRIGELSTVNTTNGVSGSYGIQIGKGFGQGYQDIFRIDNDGEFILRTTDLTIVNGNASFSGTLTATTGTIAKLEILEDYLLQTTTTGEVGIGDFTGYTGEVNRGLYIGEGLDDTDVVGASQIGMWDDSTFMIRTRGSSFGYVQIINQGTSRWGIEGADSSGNVIFRLGSSNKIAGANFTENTMYSINNGESLAADGFYLNWADEQMSLGNNIVFDSGDAYFNNVYSQNITFLGSTNTVHAFVDHGYQTRINSRTKYRTETYEVLNINSGYSLSTVVPSSSNILINYTIVASYQATNGSAVRKGHFHLRTNSSSSATYVNNQIDYTNEDSYGVQVPFILSASSDSLTIGGTADKATIHLEWTITDQVGVAASPPPTPQNVSLSKATSKLGTGIRVDWDTSAGAEEYVVQRYSNTWTTIATVSSAFYVDPVPFSNQNQDYYYRVRATNSAGTSAYSNTVGPSSFNSL